MLTSQRRRLFALISLFIVGVVSTATSPEFPRDGTVIELVESNFDVAIATFDFILVNFYAPWCGHCKRLSPELDAAAPVLAALSEPVFIAKIDADKYRKLASKYEIDGFPTLKVLIHGVPVEYTGPRKADLLVRFLKKFVAPDVSLLESDSAIRGFVENTGSNFPIFIGFGLDESIIVEHARKYKKKAWFSLAKDFSEGMMDVYDFNKVPALISLLPKYSERSVFYGPFEGQFVEDFIRQSLLPPTVPINAETLKLMSDDKRKIVLAIMEDASNENSMKLINILRSAATANRDLIFGYVGVKQWEEFTTTFDVSKGSQLPKLLVWSGTEEYHLVEGLEYLTDVDQGSQISYFLEGYREGRTIKKNVNGPSVMDFIKSPIGMQTIFLIVLIVAVIMLVLNLCKQIGDDPQSRHRLNEELSLDKGISDSEKESCTSYQPGEKED